MIKGYVKQYTFGPREAVRTSQPTKFLNGVEIEPQCPCLPVAAHLLLSGHLRHKSAIMSL